MGIRIDQERFSDAERAQFSKQLSRDIDALALLLERDSFGTLERSVGAELEVNLVGASGGPAAAAAGVLDALDTSSFAPELNTFNIEFNAPPLALAGRPFSAMGDQFEGALASIRTAASSMGARPAVVGILPTLSRQELTTEWMTDKSRYRALNIALREQRQGQPFHICINGEAPLELDCPDVTLEGANTSLQIHLQVPPNLFRDTYNAAQLAIAPALAACGNSPLFLQHLLWEETRIALFKQATDDRPSHAGGGRTPARVGFGHGWVRSGALELFAESVALFAPILPVSSTEDPLAEVRAGGVPALEELRLHHGTIWRWNRAVFDPAAGGHLRIEFRALPAGPTTVDMMANTAFLLGLTLGLTPRIQDMLLRIPFASAEWNFYRAAEKGLSAELLWPSPAAPSPRPVAAAELVLELIPTARDGLVQHGVDAAEADALLDILRARVESGQTGAVWQRRAFRALNGQFPPDKASALLLEQYLERSESNTPVHSWTEVS